MPILLALIFLLTVWTVSHAATVELQWEPPKDTTGIDRYEVYRTTGPNATQVWVCGTPKTGRTCNDLQPLPGTSYYAVFSWGKATGWSEASNIAEISIEETVAPGTPAVPQKMKAVVTIGQVRPPAAAAPPPPQTTMPVWRLAP